MGYKLSFGQHDVLLTLIHASSSTLDRSYHRVTHCSSAIEAFSVIIALQRIKTSKSPDPDYFALSRLNMIMIFVTGKWMQLLEWRLTRGYHAIAKLMGGWS